MISENDKRKLFSGEYLSYENIRFKIVHYNLVDGCWEPLIDSFGLDLAIHFNSKIINGIAFITMNNNGHIQLEFSNNQNRPDYLNLDENIKDKIDEYLLWLAEPEAFKELQKLRSLLNFYN